MAGLVGMTILHFRCSMHTAPHVAVAHLGIALAAALLVYALDRNHIIEASEPRTEVRGCWSG